jgi:hypothetical protein
VQSEFVTVSAERCDNEVHFVLHEAGDEVNVSREPIEPRNNEWATRSPSLLQTRCESCPQQQRVLATASLNILMPSFDGESFALAERLNVISLRSQS